VGQIELVLDQGPLGSLAAAIGAENQTVHAHDLLKGNFSQSLIPGSPRCQLPVRLLKIQPLLHFSKKTGLQKILWLQKTWAFSW
jgi:hypothetical protein